MAVSFDLFGTLVERVDAGEEAPAARVAAELVARDVAVPDDWAAAYRERHIDAPEGAEVPLPAHVSAALASRGVDAPGNAARRAVVSKSPTTWWSLGRHTSAQSPTCSRMR